MKSNFRLTAIALGVLLPVLAAFAITLTRQNAALPEEPPHLSASAKPSPSKGKDDCNCESKNLPEAGHELQSALSRNVRSSTFVFSEAKGKWIDTRAKR